MLKSLQTLPQRSTDEHRSQFCHKNVHLVTSLDENTPCFANVHSVTFLTYVNRREDNTFAPYIARTFFCK